MLRTMILLLGVLLTLTGCGEQDAELSPKIANLIGTWQLTAPDSTYAVTLDIAYDSANPPHDITPFKTSGKAAVNQYNVRMYASIDGKISADDVASTKIGGPANVLQFEQTYFDALRAVVRFEQPTDAQLRLYYGGTRPGILVYKKLK